MNAKNSVIEVYSFFNFSTYKYYKKSSTKNNTNDETHKTSFLYNTTPAHEESDNKL